MDELSASAGSEVYEVHTDAPARPERKSGFVIEKLFHKGFSWGSEPNLSAISLAELKG